jgi:CRP-like cAMP-binding protein
LKLVLYPAGEYVIKTGELATDMYFIINGMVHIYVNHNIKVAELGQGKYFGEIALV